MLIHVFINVSDLVPYGLHTCSLYVFFREFGLSVKLHMDDNDE